VVLAWGHLAAAALVCVVCSRLPGVRADDLRGAECRWQGLLHEWGERIAPHANVHNTSQQSDASSRPAQQPGPTSHLGQLLLARGTHHRGSTRLSGDFQNLCGRAGTECCRWGGDWRANDQANTQQRHARQGWSNPRLPTGFPARVLRAPVLVFVQYLWMLRERSQVAMLAGTRCRSVCTPAWRRRGCSAAQRRTIIAASSIKGAWSGRAERWVHCTPAQH
jgi:hypothetical protein